MSTCVQMGNKVLPSRSKLDPKALIILVHESNYHFQYVKRQRKHYYLEYPSLPQHSSFSISLFWCRRQPLPVEFPRFPMFSCSVLDERRKKGREREPRSIIIILISGFPSSELKRQATDKQTDVLQQADRQPDRQTDRDLPRKEQGRT